ncbi:MAG: hypothetical protein Cons2KO_30330 [Congregibacter sp.]
MALAVIAKHRHVALLHQTGLAAQDQIWIEYNGLLAKPDHQVDSLIAITKAITEESDVSCFHLSMLPADYGTPLLDAFPYSRVYQEVTGWKRDLQAIRSCGSTVLNALSPNTRYQVRRSIRRYEQCYGTPRIEEMGSQSAAERAWNEASIWHKQRWSDSGFNNPEFSAFHCNLQKCGLDHGITRIYRVICGNETIGIFYFLSDGKVARFYLQGVKRERDAKLKPGLTGHCLLMQHLLDEGWDEYDFMGGDSQYKRQLADVKTRFVSVRVHDGSRTEQFLDSMRKLRNRVLGARTGGF